MRRKKNSKNKKERDGERERALVLSHSFFLSFCPFHRQQYKGNVLQTYNMEQNKSATERTD
jgi:hypothetical protein